MSLVIPPKRSALGGEINKRLRKCLRLFPWASPVWYIEMVGTISTYPEIAK